MLQDTMLKVIDRIGDFRGHGGRGATPLWGWLRQIAVNEALMRLRQGRRRQDELTFEAHEPIDESRPPPSAADASQVTDPKKLHVLPPAPPAPPAPPKPPRSPKAAPPHAL